MERSKLPAHKVVLFVNFFVRKHFSHDRVIKNLEINKSTSMKWRNICFKVCENWLHHQEPISGENVVVEIDETLKYNRGRELFLKSCNTKDVLHAFFYQVSSLYKFPHLTTMQN